MKKGILILILLILALFSVSCIYAADVNDTLVASEDTNQIELSDSDKVIEDNLQTSEENDELASTDYDEAIAQTDTEVLGEDSAKYSDLAAEISQPGNIKLNHKNYTYDEGETITIREDNKVIDGNGAVIDMNGSTIRAFYIIGSGVTIKNLTIKNANYNGNGGAIYFTMLAASGTVTNCNFADNTAYRGGAVYFFSTGTVSNCNFADNTAGDWGGAIFFMDTGTVSNCNFTGNNAATGSAIYFYKWDSSYTLTVSDSTFLNNRANAGALDIVKTENNITITFTGQNNLLNAIYSREDAEVAFYNVTYWGANGITTVSATMSGSNKATGQNITVGVVVNNELVLSEVMVTDENGMIVLDISAGENYYISVRHDADSYYTEAEKTISNNINVNVTSQTTTNKTVNITAKSNIPQDVVQGKLLFILPDGTSDGMVIEANYSGNGTWWAKYTLW